MTDQAAVPDGRTVDAGGLPTFVLEGGTGSPVLLLHGSGPGVSAAANWRFVWPLLVPHFRLIAPDAVGFGDTPAPTGYRFTRDAWTTHVLDLMDALELERVSVIGNSFGGALGLSLAERAPDRVDRLVLMGSVGTHFELTPELDAVWGFDPARDSMRDLMTVFAYDTSRVTDEVAATRMAAATRPGVAEAFAAMFPAPRERWIDELALPDDVLARIEQPTLLVHGRDDRVIPLSSSLRLLGLLPDADLHVFARCGHWVQIEAVDRFAVLVRDFLS